MIMEKHTGSESFDQANTPAFKISEDLFHRARVVVRANLHSQSVQLFSHKHA